MTALEMKAGEIAQKYKGLSLQEKIGIIAKVFGGTEGTIQTSPCSGKWRGTSDVSILFDTGKSLFIGNRITRESKTKKAQMEMVDTILPLYNPEIVEATKEAALPVLLEREKKDNAIAKCMGLKPYRLLTVELNDGTDGLSSGYMGWYYVTLEVGGKIFAHLESGLKYDIISGRLSAEPSRKPYFTAGGLDPSNVDFVFNNVGFSSTSGMYTLHISDDVRQRGQQALAGRKRADEAGKKENKEMKKDMDKAEVIAKDLLDFVNAFGYDSDTFAKTICRGHKTLQQSVMRLFIATIRKMAEVPADERNEAAVGLAKAISKIADDYSLPLV